MTSTCSLARSCYGLALVRLRRLGHSLSEAIPLHHGVEDISAVEAAPARYPHTFCTLHEIEEVIFRHTTLTTCTGHDALLVCLSSHHKSKGSPLSRLDPKEVPQMKGDVTQPAFIHDGSPSRRSLSYSVGMFSCCTTRADHRSSNVPE